MQACVSIPQRMIDLWQLHFTKYFCIRLQKWSIYFVSGCFSFSSAMRSGRTIVKQDLGCACKDPKYRIWEGDEIFGNYLDTKLFQLQLRNCGPKTPVVITITMSDVKRFLYFGYCSVAAIGSPMWAAAARTLALLAATASKCEIIGRNFTWELSWLIDDERLRYFVTTCMSQRKSAEVEGAIFPRLLATDIVQNIKQSDHNKEVRPRESEYKLWK